MLSPIGKGSEGSVPSIGQLYKSMNPLPKFVTSIVKNVKTLQVD